MKYVLTGHYGDQDSYSYQPEADEKVIPFALLDAKDRLTCGIHDSLKALAKLGVYPSERGLDLLVLAAHVQAADTRLSREKTSQDNWTREIGLVVPVDEPDLWIRAVPVIKRILNFLTGDLWTLYFRARPQGIVSLTKQTTPTHPFNRLSLFSGGLDSLIGAINLLEAGHIPLLVSHSGDGATGHAQDELFTALQEHYPEQALARLNLWMLFAKNLIPNAGTETSTRGRSFLFFAAGIFAGTGLGSQFTLQVPENGLIALNVPLDKLRLGALSTRTTHPFYISRWNELLGILGIPAKIANPFWDHTKGEMVARCANRPLLQSLVKQALSCASPTKGRWIKRAKAQCGYCLPCLIRRAALEAGLGKGQDPTDYLCQDLKERPLNTLKAEGQQIRSFQYAAARLQAHPELAKILIHKPGSLSDEPQNWPALADVYRRGLEEVSALLTGVQTLAQ